MATRSTEDPIKYVDFSSYAQGNDDYTRWSLLSQAQKKQKPNAQRKSGASSLLDDLNRFNPAPKKVNGTFIAPKDPKQEEPSLLFKKSSNSLTSLLDSAKAQPIRPASAPAMSTKITFSSSTQTPQDKADSDSEPKADKQSSARITPADLLAQAQRAKAALAQSSQAAQAAPSAEDLTELSGKQKAEISAVEAELRDEQEKVQSSLNFSASEPQTLQAKLAQAEKTAARPVPEARIPEPKALRELPPSLRNALEQRPQIEERPSIADLIAQRKGKRGTDVFRHSQNYTKKSESSLMNVIHQSTLKPSIEANQQHNLASTEGVVFREFAQEPVLHELKNLKTKNAQYSGNFEQDAPKVMRTSAAEVAQEQRALQVKQNLSKRGILTDLKDKVKHSLNPHTMVPELQAAAQPEPATQPLLAEAQSQSEHSSQKYTSLFNKNRYGSRRELRNEQRLSDIFKRIESCQ
ncbi:MAG: hypothetical protein K6F05_02910 [Succinivibrio sp.]|nr:hypothetical protein [Succinivibrio sp.]